jgi:hypothetical protein
VIKLYLKLASTMEISGAKMAYGPAKNVFYFEVRGNVWSLSGNAFKVSVITYKNYTCLTTTVYHYFIK